MNLRKIIPTAIGALALCVLLPMAPQPGEAATVANVETPKVGDIQLWVTLSEGDAGDQYRILLNGEEVNHGALDEDVTTPDRMFFYIGYVVNGQGGTPVKAGDKLELQIENEEGAMQSYPVTVAGRANAEPPNQHEARIEHRGAWGRRLCDPHF